MVASPEYVEYYNRNKSMLMVPSTLDDDRNNTAYARSNYLDRRSPVAVQGMTAVYYALVEEVDEWVGRLLDGLDQLGLTNETMGTCRACFWIRSIYNWISLTCSCATRRLSRDLLPQCCSQPTMAKCLGRMEVYSAKLNYMKRPSACH